MVAVAGLDDRRKRRSTNAAGSAVATATETDTVSASKMTVGMVNPCSFVLKLVG